MVGRPVPGRSHDRPCARAWRASSRPSALTHLPENRATQEQAIDLRLDLRGALWYLEEIGQMLDYLCQAATVAEALNDQPRLGRASAYICRYFTAMGDHNGGVASGQRALAIAQSLRDFALQVMAQHVLGVVYYTLSDYPRAMELLKSNVESLLTPLSSRRAREPMPGGPLRRREGGTSCRNDGRGWRARWRS